MTSPVPFDEIEEIVGMKRHPRYHYGRAVSETRIFYILHSEECRRTFLDLRACPFSKALDRGVENPVEDVLLRLYVFDGDDELITETVQLGML